MNVKNVKFRFTIVVMFVYVVLCVAYAILYTQLSFIESEYTLCIEDQYNYCPTYHGYYEPLDAVVDNNKRKLGSIVNQEPEVMLGYLCTSGDYIEAWETWDAIQNKAEEICKDVKSENGYSYDYLCVRELAKYVAYNTYYDWDAFYNHVGIDTINVKTVMETKRATCAGYSNYFVALCEARGYNTVNFRGGVPAESYDIGYEDLENSPTNHEWVGVYIDNRLVLIDITWMSSNWYINGEKHTGKRIRYDYFDLDFESFCVEHRIDLAEERNFGEIFK